MKRTNWTPAKITKMVSEWQAGQSSTKIAKKYRISVPTFYNLKRRLETSMVAGSRTAKAGKTKAAASFKTAPKAIVTRNGLGLLVIPENKLAQVLRVLGA